MSRATITLKAKAFAITAASHNPAAANDNARPRTVLAFGAGVDSTAILALILAMRTDPATAAAAAERTVDELTAALEPLGTPVDAVTFADPGAEFTATYDNARRAGELLAADGIRFERLVKTDAAGARLTITDWLLKNGTVPVMPGGPHACSLKFKGEIMQAWARRTYGATTPITWLIGIEANETRRARFKGAKGATQGSRFPLVELGLDRAACKRILERLGWPITVRKSSCVFCPFMSEPEICDAYENEPEAWHLAETIEARFKATSAAKHQAWIDAGRPLVGKSQRAPVGMWRRDAWADGARLVAKRIDGAALTLTQWAARFERGGISKADPQTTPLTGAANA